MHTTTKRDSRKAQRTETLRRKQIRSIKYGAK